MGHDRRIDEAMGDADDRDAQQQNERGDDRIAENLSDLVPAGRGNAKQPDAA